MLWWQRWTGIVVLYSYRGVGGFVYFLVQLSWGRWLCVLSCTAIVGSMALCTFLYSYRGVDGFVYFLVQLSWLLYRLFLANVNSRSPSLYAVVRPSVCRLSVLSVVCLSVGNARAPYSGGSHFPQYFYGVRYLGHPLTSTARMLAVSWLFCNFICWFLLCLCGGNCCIGNHVDNNGPHMWER